MSPRPSARCNKPFLLQPTRSSRTFCFCLKRCAHEEVNAPQPCVCICLKHDPFCPPLLERLPYTHPQIVLLRTSRIGDVLGATPALRALRVQLPEAEISIITVSLPYCNTYQVLP